MPNYYFKDISPHFHFFNSCYLIADRVADISEKVLCYIQSHISKRLNSH